MTRPAPPRCRCGCGGLSPTNNSGGFASRACYQLWIVRQRPPIDDAQITALRLEGKSLEAVAKAVGLGEAMVRRRLLALGVKPPEKPPSVVSTKRRHQKREGEAAPGRHDTKSLPWRRVGTYVHPKLERPWTFGCPCCSRHLLGPMVEGLPAWKGVRL